MSYVKDNLMPNEKILFLARIHPAIFLPAVVSFVAGVGIVMYAINLASKQDTGLSLLAGGLLCMAGLFFLWAILLGLQALTILFTTEFAITNRRIIAKTGFVRRHTLEMLLHKIESVAVRQSILGRLLNFGTVTVTGTGGTREGFRAIVEPLAVRRMINQIIEHYTQAYAQQQKTSLPGSSG